MSDVALQITDGEHITPRRSSFGIKLLSARNVRDGFLDFSDVDYIDADEYRRLSKRCNPQKGDILISCSGSIGRVSLVSVDEPLALVRSVALVRPDPTKINPKYLEKYLQTSILRRMMEGKANASSQANLFQNQIRSLPVLLPQKAFQDEFVRKIIQIESERSLMLRQIGHLNSLFGSLQHRAFRGEL